MILATVVGMGVSWCCLGGGRDEVLPAKADAAWPFAILRSYGSYADNAHFTERVFAAQERHPGLFDEIWFCGDGGLDYSPAERGENAAKKNLSVRERCRALGIAFSYQQVWPGCRRHAILDALDFATPGGLPARLLTDGYSVAISVRKTAEGRTAGVFLFYLGLGETPPLEIAIRRGASAGWTVSRPRRPSVAGEIVRKEADEVVVRVPPMNAYDALLVAGKNVNQ